MTGTAVKKKRFEGLIQFQEPLRQALVCIQAAQADRFATAIQSDYLRLRDSEDLSHFVLSRSAPEWNGLSPKLEAHHLLMAIEQIEDGQLEWKKKLPEADVNIAAWLNSGDPLVCQQLYLVLALAVSQSSRFTLAELAAQGSLTAAFADAGQHLWMSQERLDLFKTIVKDTSKIFNPQKTVVSTDGCTVSILVEGETELTWEKAAPKLVATLKNPSRHLVLTHYIGGAKPRIQCVYLTPMRLPLKELQSSALKGFVLLRDIKPPA